MNILGEKFSHLFHEKGRLVEILDAIQFIQEAVDVTRHPEQPRFSYIRTLKYC